jgi:hypothetical protein
MLKIVHSASQLEVGADFCFRGLAHGPFVGSSQPPSSGVHGGRLLVDTTPGNCRSFSDYCIAIVERHSTARTATGSRPSSDPEAPGAAARVYETHMPGRRFRRGRLAQEDFCNAGQEKLRLRVASVAELFHTESATASGPGLCNQMAERPSSAPGRRWATFVSRS